MSFNWSSLASNIGNLTSALTAAGVSPANMSVALGQIGALSNPSQAEEMQLCTQILLASGNPVMVEALTMKLVTEAGIPAAAAAVAMTLTRPGVDVVTTTLQIESLIKSGG